MPRTIIVLQNSEILDHPTTKTLHVYENGDVLVTTDAPVTESGKADEIPVRQGVVLPNQQRFKDLAGEGRSHPLDRVIETAEVNAYIELIGPVDRSWIATLLGLGIELLQFHPENSYLCRATKAEFQRALALPFVLNVVPLSDATKPGTIVAESGEQQVCVVVQGDRRSIAMIMQELNSLPEVTIDPNQQVDVVDFYLRIHATVTAIGQEALLRHPRVLAVEAFTAPQLEDEVAGLIIAGQYDAAGKPNGSYLGWLEDQGLNGNGVTIGIVDAGVDGSHPAFGDRVKDLCGRKSWHGTFVAGHAAGCYLSEQDDNRFIYGLGVAPKANLLIQSNQNSATALCQETVSETVAGAAGTIQNNSWGSGTCDPMTYGSLEATYDKLVRHADPNSPTPKPLTICFSSGNSGTSGLTRPKAAKNLIVTGNSETYRPTVGKDQSDNINEVYTGPRGSSHGNCGDGRIVPHLVAPGEWTAAANYDSHPGEREYISAKLTWGGGSSAASPKVAGACALLTQWWRGHNQGADPSPALLKALIVNGAEPMQTGGPIPNKLQGWGRLNLSNILSEAVPHFYLDQTVMLTQRGEQKTWTIRVTDPYRPVKITLCWTDPPGAIGSGTAQASAIVNKLALRANANGRLYRANQFQNGWSYPEGSAAGEGWDNLQNIYLQAGAIGETVQISVTALELTTNCLTGQISPPQQDFALVICNGSLDDGATPAKLFVAVDPLSKAPLSPPASSQADRFWSGAANQDAQELDRDWWQTVRPASNPAPPKPTTANAASAAAADLWWLQDDSGWKKAETEQEDGTVAALRQSLQTATVAVAIGGSHQVVVAGGIAAESQRLAQPTLVEVNPATGAAADLAGLGSLPFSQALAQLVQTWSRSGAELAGRRVAVLVVRSTTRVSPDDLAALRRLAFGGQLFLVSDDAQILAFLAQRIHRCAGIQLRLAADARKLAALVHDTLIEASGAQQAEVNQVAQASLGAVITHHLFQVLPADRHLTLQIQFPASLVPDLQLVLPDESTLPIDASTAGVKVFQQPGLLQLDLEQADFPQWAGLWKLLLKQPGAQALSRVRVWVWSGLHWQVRQQTPTLQAEADRDPQELLLAVSGSSVRLSRLQSQPRLIDASAIAQESERHLEVQAELPRSEGRPLAETQRDVYAPTLSALIRTPAPNTGAVVLDLPLRVEGVDEQGYRFARLLRRNLLQLQPRSLWRQQIEPAPPILFTPAQIVEVEVEAGEPIGLTLEWGDRRRRVVIASPQLRQQLAHAFRHNFPNHQLRVGVVGNELYGIYCPLQPSGSRSLLAASLLDR